MLRQTVLAVGMTSHARLIGGGKPDEEAMHRSSSITGGLGVGPKNVLRKN